MVLLIVDDEWIWGWGRIQNILADDVGIRCIYGTDLLREYAGVKHLQLPDCLKTPHYGLK